MAGTRMIFVTLCLAYFLGGTCVFAEEDGCDMTKVLTTLSNGLAAGMSGNSLIGQLVEANQNSNLDDAMQKISSTTDCLSPLKDSKYTKEAIDKFAELCNEDQVQASQTIAKLAKLTEKVPNVDDSFIKNFLGEASIGDNFQQAINGVIDALTNGATSKEDIVKSLRASGFPDLSGLLSGLAKGVGSVIDGALSVPGDIVDSISGDSQSGGGRSDHPRVGHRAAPGGSEDSNDEGPLGGIFNAGGDLAKTGYDLARRTLHNGLTTGEDVLNDGIDIAGDALGTRREDAGGALGDWVGGGTGFGGVAKGARDVTRGAGKAAGDVVDGAEKAIGGAVDTAKEAIGTILP